MKEIHWYILSFYLSERINEFLCLNTYFFEKKPKKGVNTYFFVKKANKKANIYIFFKN